MTKGELLMVNQTEDIMRLSKCYKKSDVYTQIIYYQIPKFLTHDAKYKALGLSEKMVYGILRDRLELSLKNNWTDNNGYVFLRYDQTKLSELLCIDRKTARKYLKNLESYGLIVIISDGQGLSNRIYITDISKELDKSNVYKKSEKEISGECNQGIKKDGENIPKEGWGKIPQGDEEKILEGDEEKVPMSETSLFSDIERVNPSSDETKEYNHNKSIGDGWKEQHKNKIILNLIYKRCSLDNIVNYDDIPEGSDLIMPIKRAIKDMVMYETTTIALDSRKKADISRDDIITQFMKLNMNVVKMVIKAMVEYRLAKPIKNPIEFAKSTLYNECDQWEARMQPDIDMMYSKGGR